MGEKVRMSFDGQGEDDPSPFVVIYNPQVLSVVLMSQIARFGLRRARENNALVSGNLKGHRKDFMEMIQTFGNPVEIVAVAPA